VGHLPRLDDVVLAWVRLWDRGSCRSRDVLSFAVAQLTGLVIDDAAPASPFDARLIKRPSATAPHSR
jgi:hypothetical protein